MSNDVNPPSAQRIRVKYEELSAVYASQVILNSTGEELFLDFSSGVITDPASKESLLPIHTRIAMSGSGARRLLTALQQLLNRSDSSSPTPVAGTDQAALPKISLS